MLEKRTEERGIVPGIGPGAAPGDGAATGAVSSERLGGRVLRPRNVVSFLLALAVLYLVYRELLGLDWGEAWAGVAGASAGLFALAFAVFYSSYPVRAVRWETLLTNAGYGRKDPSGCPMPSTLGLAGIMYLAWFANCVTVARLGDAYRAYLLKRASGVSFAVTLGTVLAERLLDLVVLALMIGGAALIFFGPFLPPEAGWALLAGLVLSSIGVVGLLAMRRLRRPVARLLPERFHPFYARLEHGVLGSLGPRLPLLVALSVAGWG